MANVDALTAVLKYKKQVSDQQALIDELVGALKAVVRLPTGVVNFDYIAELIAKAEKGGG